MAAPPDNSWRDPATPLRSWLAVTSVAFGTFVMVTTEFLPIGLLSRIAEDLRVTEGTAGLMVAVPGAVAAVAAPAAAFGMRSVNRRWMLIALTLLVLASNLLAAGSQSFGAMLVARCMLGVAVGSFWAFAGAVGRRLVQEHDGATATAIVLAGISIGTVLGLPLGTLLGNWAGWRAAFDVGAGLSLVALTCQLLLLPPLPPAAGSRRSALAPLRASPMLRAGFGFAFLLVLGHFSAYTYLEPYLTQQLQLNTSWLGIALGAYGVAGLVGNFAGARLADSNVVATFRLVATLLALSVLALALAQGTGVAMLTVVGWGIAFGATPACIQIWLYRADPAFFEASSALMVTVFQIGLAAGSWIGGMGADRLGQRDTMLVGAGIVALGALAMLMYRRPMHEPASGAAPRNDHG